MCIHKGVMNWNEPILKKMRQYLSRLYGINYRNILSCHNFDISTALPQDSMHVLLEGVTQCEIKEILKKYVLEDCPFSLFSFNGAINYICSQISCDVEVLLTYPRQLPVDILTTGDNRLHQSSSEMRSFLILLPFILCDLIDPTEKLYTFIQELLAICNIIFSPVVSFASVSLLQDMIRRHLSNFTELSPGINIIPKQHYLLHFPMLMRLHRPTSMYSCMHHESKHKNISN